MRDPVLDDAVVDGALSGTDPLGWELVGGRLMKTVSCRGFAGSLAFVNEVGALAEAADHHPDIDIRYDRVTMALVTHDSGGITQRDLDLARQIDGVTAGLR